MTTEKVADLEFAKLSDFFTPEKFRTVSSELLGQSGGLSEVGVTFYTHSKFARTLSYNSTGVLTLYGFALLNDNLREINQAHYIKSGILDKVSLNDCGEVFILVFELKTGNKILKKVTSDEVRYLLDNCRHPTPIFE